MIRRNQILALTLTAIFAALVPDAAQAFSFSPTRIFTSVAPGDEKSVTFEIINESSRESSVDVAVRAMEKSEPAGQPKFSNKQTATSIAPFVILPASEFVMKAGERRNFSFTVKVPADASPGSYFGAIHFGSSVIDGQVGALAVTGPLVFLTVLGDNVGSIALAPPKFPAGLTNSLPTGLDITVKNDGTLVEIPNGSARIKNIFGFIVREFSINSVGAALLPGDERVYRIGVPSGEESLIGELINFGFGPYTMQIKVTAANANTIEVVSDRFWVLPWRALLLALIVSLIFASVLGSLFPRKSKAAV